MHSFNDRDCIAASHREPGRVRLGLLATLGKAARMACIGGALALVGTPATAAEMNLSPMPLFLSPSVAPLNMLVVGRDHKLYYEAYNDYTDLDGDGQLELRYKPTIDYYGYFDSFKCYTHDRSGNGSGSRFMPVSAAPQKTCGRRSGQWSGDFLNYLTTSRIDALRKVLYGGRRSTDTRSSTILERSYIPQDAHSWGKEYTSIAVDGYDIRNYAPLSLPNNNRRHLFANTTLLSSNTSRTQVGAPLLRVLTNRSERIWNWVSIERPVAGNQVLAASGSLSDVTPQDYSVRVAVCVRDLMEANCRAYSNDSFKPVGLLQEFGENDAMYFGLITGSYAKNTSGGVLRKRVDSINDEINADGTFRNNVVGIIATLNRLRVTGFGGDNVYDCGWSTATRPIGDGDCRMWGNPIAEMMYEGMRYFAGLESPTSAYHTTGGSEETELGGLPAASWNDPYGTGRPVCAKPFQTVVSDINPSYDTDQLPGSAFSSFSGDLSGLNVSALGQTIWDGEFGSGATRNIFIGQSGAVVDGAPTAKQVSSFGNIRGLSPEEPTKLGGYYSASVAYHGRINDIHPRARGDQNVRTFAVALASPLPKIEIPVGDRRVTLVPFAKSVGGSVEGIDIDPDASFQPTNQIVDFYVESLTPTSGRFRVNFEDVEQGADHDMDAIVIYEYTVRGNQVTVNMTSEYAAGSIIQHMGYVISGTTRDGIYLEVRDRDTAERDDPDYRLDTPPGSGPSPGNNWRDRQRLPLDASRSFTAGASTGADLLRDPLWYAAKWGGFDDLNGNGVPDPGEWDRREAGTPDNYFLVTNALTLSEQLRQAFIEIIDRNSSAAAAVLNGGLLRAGSMLYQPRFKTLDWTGELIAYPVPPQGRIAQGVEDRVWEAGSVLPQPGQRRIITANSSGLGAPFRWESLDATRRGELDADPATAQVYLNYLRGDGSAEGEGAGRLRPRQSKLGDIINSAPMYVPAPSGRYSDTLEAAPYSAFARQRANRSPMVYVGANDGMLHGFDAATGVERLAFIPGKVFGRLNRLPQQNYAHQYYVDGSPNVGDAFVNGAWRTVLAGGLGQGGQGIYALDVTDPARFANAESASQAQQLLMWEFTDEEDADLGYTYSQPAIVRLQNGRWAAIFGNGYNNTVMDGNVSSTGNAVLYVVDIATGELLRKFDTGVGMSADPGGQSMPNGLATPVVVDVDGDRVADHAYAGDLFGNLWKFDLRSTTASQWRIAYGTASQPLPLFTARDASGTPQPITVRPEVARGPRSVGVMVLFGTGKFLETEDKNSTPRREQTFYGVVDRNTYTNADRITSRNALTQQTIEQELPVPVAPEQPGEEQAEQAPDQDGTRMYRVTSQRPLTGSGWYLDLLSPSGYQGERAVTNPTVSDDRVLFTTLIPNDDPCGFGGSSWSMTLDLLSGARLPGRALDINNDGRIDDQDEPASGTSFDEIVTQMNVALCDGEGCETDTFVGAGSSGNVAEGGGAPSSAQRGRQSWRQIR